MAKLIVTRPEMRWRGRVPAASSLYQILIDSQRTGSIGPGKTVEVELPPGPHHIRARIAFLGSQPVAIDAGQDETHQLVVGPNLRYSKMWAFLCLFMIVPIFAQVAVPLVLSRWSAPGPASFANGWQMAITFAILVFLFLVQMTFLVLTRNDALNLKEIPASDWSDRQAADFLRAQSVRVRVTVRHFMVAIAIVAISLWAGIEAARRVEHPFFQIRVQYHAQMEALCRDSQARWTRFAVEWQHAPGGAGQFQVHVARAAAKAAYHAAMKHKYEQAISEMWFSVAPDPPEPPFP
jgi:hypothetical protein